MVEQATTTETEEQIIDDQITAEDQTGGGEEAESQEEQTVPMSRFQEVLDQVEQLKEQITINAQQQLLSKANQPTATGQIGAQDATPAFDIFKEVGLEDDDDVPTVAQLRKIVNHSATVYDRRLSEIAFLQAHTDFADIVGTADQCLSGQYAEPLATALKKNPALVKMIAQSPVPRIAAYEVAKLQKNLGARTSVTNKDASDAISEAVNNANRIKSSANTKGGGALSAEGRFDSMSDEEFMKLAVANGAPL